VTNSETDLPDGREYPPMHLSAVERLLLVLSGVTLAYRLVRGEWPVAVEVEDA